MNYNSYLKLNERLKEDLYQILSYGNDVCTVPVQHKNVVASPLWLDENKIKYEFVIQNPGDLLFIRTSVPHQVWNVVKNLAEAVNYGSMTWNACSSRVFICGCSMRQIPSRQVKHSLELIRNYLHVQRKAARNVSKTIICIGLVLTAWGLQVSRPPYQLAWTVNGFSGLWVSLGGLK